MNTIQQHTHTYRPYCYLIGWSKLNKFYYGVRYSKRMFCLYDSGCHPDDLWVKYFTSSQYVKEYRKKHGEPDIIQVRRCFLSAEKAINWEKIVLRRILAKSNKFLNKNVAGSVIYDDEVRKKISKAGKGKIVSQETRDKISSIRKGKPRSEQTKEKIRNFQKGRIKSEETRLKLSISNKNKIISYETRQKISKAGKGRIPSQETRQKLSKIRKGRKLSESHKQKISESNKGKNLGRKLSESHKKKIGEGVRRKNSTALLPYFCVV